MILIISFLFTMIFFGVLNISPFIGLEPTPMIELPTLIFILIPTIFFIIVTKSHRVIVYYLRHSLKKNYSLKKFELQQLAFTLGVIMKIVLASGFLGFFLGMIVMLFHLDDPGRIGPSVSLSTFSIFYSMLISFFLIFPTKVWAEYQLIEKN